ncbi:thiol reductant ABC exporter subunit CydD [Paenibacillus sp. P96]|uniref:Thiol reductant ABC exporter subunit CydD n=1 Tax=Paenibacillus zeirhizosphaerae TaxID=2987519 RepID=A0ABT9FWB3_9BACL|nr:thiol reductant ABC exporter subunit CydD [Paenibacillus sp. P96]MDP4098831.1 thiol reductant ABC exporter subunit CydD [Paenibacillus sp. P96]
MDKTWFELPGIRSHLLKLSLLSIMQGIALVVQATLLAHSITMLFNGTPVQSAYAAVIAFVAALAARNTLSWLQRRQAGRFADASAERIREALLQAIFEKEDRSFIAGGSGQKVTLVLDGVDRFRKTLELALPRTVDMACITAIVWLSIIRLDVASGIILAITLPVLIGFFILLGLAARSQADRQWRSYRMLAHHFTDALRGLQTLAFLGLSKAHGATVGRVSESYRTLTMKTLRIAFLSSLALDFFSMLSVASVAVGLGLRLVDGSMGIGIALAVLLLAPEYFAPVRMLGTDYHATLDGKEAWRTIRDVLALSPPEPEGSEEADPLHADTTGHSSASQTVLTEKALEKPPYAIQLSDICVSGEHGGLILDRVNAEWPSAIRRLGIVGASGAGKTTLLQVLTGLLPPSSGQLHVNDVQIDRANASLWQKNVSLLPQHPYIFSQTLLDNLRLYSPEATLEQVNGAIDAVGLRAWVDSVPKGLQEQIGEGGRGLSGGQAQRVALARALLGERSILLLDEPTSHLDLETEWELKQTILSVLHDRQLVLATHRLHWMDEMDYILVLDAGKVVESGTHADLIQREGLYYRLLTNTSKEDTRR